MRLPSLQSLVTLESVIKHQSISLAAEELCVTHSAVSQNIKQLEKQLGSTLLLRQGRNIVATDHAIDYMEAVTPHIEGLRRATRKFQSLSQQGTLTLKMVSTLALRWFLPRLADLKRSCGGLNIKLVTESQSDLTHLPAEIDAALGYSSQPIPAHLFHFQLAPSQLVLLANKTQKVEQALAESAAIYVTHPLRKRDWQQWCEQANLPQPEPDKRIYLPSSAQALEALSAGAGVLVTQQLFAESGIQLQQFHPIGPTITDTTKGYYFYCHKQKIEQPEISLFYQWLQRQF